MSTNRVITVVQTEADVITELGNLVQSTANKAIERDDVFKIGLSGCYWFQNTLFMLYHVSASSVIFSFFLFFFHRWFTYKVFNDRITKYHHRLVKMEIIFL